MRAARWCRLTALAAGALLIVAACSGDDDSTGGPTESTDGRETTAASTSAPDPSTTASTAETSTTPVPSTSVDPAAPTCPDGDGEAVVPEGTRRGRGEQRELCLDGQWVADPVLDTATTVPTDTELAAATVDSGVYAVPDELPLGLYRVAGGWAMFDDQDALLDEDAIDPDEVGYSLLSVGFGVPRVGIDGSAVSVEYVPVFDPLAESAAQGTYLVGVDIAPGTYRVTGDGAYAARLRLGEAGDWELLGEEAGESVTITVEPDDFAFRFVGALEAE